MKVLQYLLNMRVFLPVFVPFCRYFKLLVNNPTMYVLFKWIAYGLLQLLLYLYDDNKCVIVILVDSKFTELPRGENVSAERRPKPIACCVFSVRFYPYV